MPTPFQCMICDEYTIKPYNGLCKKCQEEEITGDFKEVLNKDSNENNQNNSSSNSSLKESIIKKIEE